MAKTLIEWCGTEIRKLGDKGGSAANHRGAKNTEKESSIDAACRVEEKAHAHLFAGELDPELVSELNAGMDRTVAGAARDMALKIRSCERLLDDLSPVLQERFGQARSFMQCACNELGRLAEISREKAQKAQKTDEGFVIVRLPDDVKGKPRFGPGWGHDPRKGTIFASKQEALDDAREWDKVISLAEALKLAQKAGLKL